MKINEKIDVILEWVWDAKRKISDETRKLSSKEYVEYISKKAEEFSKKYNIKLTRI